MDIRGWKWRRISDDLENCEAYLLNGLSDQDVDEGLLWEGPSAEVFQLYESPVFTLENYRATNRWRVTIYQYPPLNEEDCGETGREQYDSLDEAKKMAQGMLMCSEGPCKRLMANVKEST